MSDIVLADESKAATLEELRGYLNTLEILPFTASTGGVILASYGLADFTASDDTAFTAQVPVFGSSVLNGSNQGETTAPTLTWTAAGDGTLPFTIKGWRARDPATNKLWAAAFGTSDVVITAAGQTYTLDPQVLLDTLV